MKDPRDIIIAPVVSEKSYALIETGVYTFKVSTKASKPEIRDAVEAIWGVKVVNVNTLNRKGKVARARRSNRTGRDGYGRSNDLPIPGFERAHVYTPDDLLDGVEVLKVNTLNRPGKRKRTRGTNRIGQRPATKRAIVTLSAGEIPLFEN